MPRRLILLILRPSRCRAQGMNQGKADQTDTHQAPTSSPLALVIGRRLRTGGPRDTRTSHMNAVLTNHIVWNWEGQTIRVGTDRLGIGPTVLLLPALSSISTRREMRLLQERLASSFATVAIDWPGVGDEPRPFPPPWQSLRRVMRLRRV